MPYEWVSSGLGGGLTGLLGALVVFLAVTIFVMQRSRISELKEENKELRTTLTRLTDVVEAWTPSEQRKRIGRS